MSDYSNYQAKNCKNPIADMLIRRKLTNVEHRDGAYILKLVDMGGGYQPVKIPDSFGYEPKLGMQAIWDTDDYTPAADLSLYDESGKLLFSLHHDDTRPEDWRDAWHDTTPVQTTLKEKIVSIVSSTDSKESQKLPDPKAVESLTPVSRVLCNALFELYPNPVWQSRSLEYIKTADDYLKDPKRPCKEPWVDFLVDALRGMQQRGVISAEGAIVKPEEFKNDAFWKRQLCRPSGGMPKDLLGTKAFSKIGASAVSARNKGIEPH